MEEEDRNRRVKRIGSSVRRYHPPPNARAKSETKARARPRHHANDTPRDEDDAQRS